MELYEKIIQWLKVAIALVMLMWFWTIANILEEILEVNRGILEILSK